MTFCDGAIWSSHIITYYDDSICHILFSQRVTQYINVTNADYVPWLMLAIMTIRSRHL